MKRIIFIIVLYSLLLYSCDCEKTEIYHIPEKMKINFKIPDTLVYATEDNNYFDTLYLTQREDKFEGVQVLKSKTCTYKVVSDNIYCYFETSSNLKGYIRQTVYTDNYVIILVRINGVEYEGVYAPTYVDYIGNTFINSILYNNVYLSNFSGGQVFANNNIGIINYYNYKTDKTYYYQPKKIYR